MKPTSSQSLFEKIASLLDITRKKVVKSLNKTMVFTYFEIGRMIIEEEQQGETRAEYGKEVLKNLSENLTAKFGKGFSEDNLSNMRKFYLIYSQNTISETVSRNSHKTDYQQHYEFELSWSHYVKLIRITDPCERQFYEKEAIKNNWSLRELGRQYDSALFTRLALSKNKEEILQLAQKGQIIAQPKDVVKDPYILEFLGLPEKYTYSESDLEQRLIDKLQQFLLELGTGFTFVARQYRISFDEKHFKIDLVFYNRLLRCFVLIDLKIGELKHQDIGQMQMYVNYYDRKIRLEDENKTIGIILCQDKSDAVVEFTLPEGNQQIFASKYMTVLPKKEDLIRLIKNG